MNLRKTLGVILLSFVCAGVGSEQLFAQSYHPKPGKSGSAAVLCVSCPGKNHHNQDNAGLPTFPYSAPIVKHAGRYVDSTQTGDVQGLGMRTIRAMNAVVASDRNRVYMMLGQTFVAYTLDKFAATVGQPLVPISNYPGHGPYYRGGSNQIEGVAPFDQYVYAERSDNGWGATGGGDGTERLKGFDWDDRGYVYLAYGPFYWGIFKDDTKTDGSHMIHASHYKESTGTSKLQSAEKIMVIKALGKYWMAVTDGGQIEFYDVTNPNVPGSATTVIDLKRAFRRFAKTTSGDHVAIIDNANNLAVYSADAFVSGGAPLARFEHENGYAYNDVTWDGSRFWATYANINNGSSGNQIVSINPSGGSYTLGSGASLGVLQPSYISYGGGYLGVVGLDQAAPGVNLFVGAGRMFKVGASAALQDVDLNGFFTRYYSYPPVGYARPQETDFPPQAFVPFKVGNKTHVIWANFGLGDVYEISTGDSITTSMNAAAGTPNPNAPSTTGPFVGDRVGFKAVSTGNPFSLTWNFGNPEGTDNTGSSLTGENNWVYHQYNGLTSAAMITDKTVSVIGNASFSDAVNDSIVVKLKQPVQRYKVKGTSTLLTGAPVGVVLGDEFVDASDGSIESHFTTWTIDGTSTNALPSTPVGVGGCGARGMSMTASYGGYDAASFAPRGGQYTTRIPASGAFAYDVKPFTAALGTPSVSGGNVVFTGVARLGSPAAFTSASPQWVVSWSLKNGNNVDLAPQQSSGVSLGFIPSYTVPLSAIAPNSTLTFTVTLGREHIVDSCEGVLPKNYTTHTESIVMDVPAAQIVKTGCGKVGEACALTAETAPTAGGSQAGWEYLWTIRNSNTNVVVATSTLKTFSPALAAAGDFVAVLETKKTVLTSTTQLSFNVQPSDCAGLPGQNNVGITVRGMQSNCSGGVGATGCTAGETILFTPSVFGYNIKACDTFSWNFGDGSATDSNRNATHVYASNGTYTVTLTISNATGSVPFNTTVIVGSTGPPPGGGLCAAPSAPASVSYSGSAGCSPTKACTTAEFITFTASGNLQSCDSVQWTFGDGTTGSGLSVTKMYTLPGTFIAAARVTNITGSSPPTGVNVAVSLAPPPDPCPNVPSTSRISINYRGLETTCGPRGTGQCKPGEAIQFDPAAFNYSFQTCDRFEWNFGDNTTSTDKSPRHTYPAAASQGTYRVSLRVYNDKGTATVFEDVAMQLPSKPGPVVELDPGPSVGAIDVPITFSAKSNPAGAIAWTWNFGDGTTDTSGNSTVSHAYSTPGVYNVSVTARLSDTAMSAPATRVVTITTIPQTRFLLPAVIHATGNGGSVWRTDLQIYTPDPTISAVNPMTLQVDLRGATKQLTVTSSTTIIEDVVWELFGRDDKGAMVITANTAHIPQIWTRTYNVSEQGTFGQYIPAIVISGTQASAVGGDSTSYISGLRQSSTFRTNLGFVNASSTATTVTVEVYDDRGGPIARFPRTLYPYQLDDFSLVSLVSGLPVDRPFSVKVSATGGLVIAYASVIDNRSNDPTYIAALPEDDFASTDYKTTIVPGVGHLAQPHNGGEWRSDVTIFNPGTVFDQVPLDLTYYDQNGAKIAETKNLVLRGGQFYQYNDLLRAGVLVPSPPDSFGSLHIQTTSLAAERYPVVTARTYFDKGANGSYGQGIAGFPSNRPNVKVGQPGLIPAVRSNDHYYTNVGLLNLVSFPTRVRVTLLDRNSGAAKGTPQEFDLVGNQSIIVGVNNGRDLLRTIDPNADRGSFKVEVVAGGPVWAFASIIDRRTSDPEYIPAVPVK